MVATGADGGSGRGQAETGPAERQTRTASKARTGAAATAALPLGGGDGKGRGQVKRQKHLPGVWGQEETGAPRGRPPHLRAGSDAALHLHFKSWALENYPQTLFPWNSQREAAKLYYRKVPAAWLVRGESYDGLKDRLFGTGSLQSFVDEHNEPLLKEAERVDEEDARRARQEGRQTRAWLSPPPPPCDMRDSNRACPAWA